MDHGVGEGSGVGMEFFDVPLGCPAVFSRTE
jgi:hypothetical protein